MILHCSFEELSALSSGAERLLGGYTGGGVAAPPELVAELEAFNARLDGDVSLETLAEQELAERLIELILGHHRRRMDALILDRYVGDEDAVTAYFDYAHTLSVRARIRQMGEEMRAIAEVMTGTELTPAVMRGLTFPD